MTTVEAPWAVGPAEVLQSLGADAMTGLTSEEATARLAVTGPNELEEGPRRPEWLRFAAQFTNTLSAVLAAAAAITLVIGDVKDTAVIGVVLLLNGIVGFTQEGRAERAVDALRHMAADHCRVRRDGVVKEVASAALVPGDIVMLESGEIVPADLRLLDVQALRMQEAALTGEAEAVTKSVDALEPTAGMLLADRRCMAFKGTSVSYGRATGVVTSTGMKTEIGGVAQLVQSHRRSLTPLQVQLASVGRTLAAGALVVCVVVFVAGVASGEPIDRMFLTAVSLAVAAIPEGLPAVVTIALALGARRMAERQAIVRRLPAVESLGSVTVICTDKTGTLTSNRMVVERAWTPAGTYTVGGEGYAPEGDVTDEGGRVASGRSEVADPYLHRIALVAAACNDAALQFGAAPDEGWRAVGDPTEGALLAFAGKLGINQAELGLVRPRRAEIGFDPSRRRMTTLHSEGDRMWVATKGALGALEPLLDPADGPAATAGGHIADEWAAAGFRVLALAERYCAGVPHPLEAAEDNLHLVGLVAITDPPRPAAAAAIEACRHAGITPVMITGDHPLTASAVAQRIGIADDDRVLSGADLDALDDEQLALLAPITAVYARTNPEQKLRIVEAWKANGALVAMTGDGVNDAPALRLADIGVAMGLTGTDVSKEAADIVLADDDFATIVHAIEEGRRIYDNIRRFVRYLLTTNSSEIWVMFLAPLIGLPIPLLPIQILWVNLVTDGLPAVALGLEPAEPDVLDRPPRPPKESVLGRGLWPHALGVGLTMAAVVIAVQGFARSAGWQWQTMVFTMLALLQLGNALSARSERQSALGLRWRANPWLFVAVLTAAAAQIALVYAPPLQRVFDTNALDPAELAVVLVASSAGFFVPEAVKWVIRRHPAAVARAGR
ncbi:MAG TPA: cation-translocating P-type ATPase [Acidimicrobiales bacterium]|nr:cation-translocating P-type ATPase [Acidimicrobiales bacterium]